MHVSSLTINVNVCNVIDALAPKRGYHNGARFRNELKTQHIAEELCILIAVAVTCRLMRVVALCICRGLNGRSVRSFV